MNIVKIMTRINIEFLEASKKIILKYKMMKTIADLTVVVSRLVRYIKKYWM